jgi:hypothetical protein
VLLDGLFSFRAVSITHCTLTAENWYMTRTSCQIEVKEFQKQNNCQLKFVEKGCDFSNLRAGLS